MKKENNKSKIADKYKTQKEAKNERQKTRKLFQIMLIVTATHYCYQL